MEQGKPDSSLPEKSALEGRTRESPQLVVEYVRLAKVLENEGDLKGAAAALQSAHFFLPNGPTILEGIRRLSKWVDATRNPVTVATTAPASPPQDNAANEDSEESPPTKKGLDEELDQLIEGLGKARLGATEEASPPASVEWGDDDGLLATETLAHIFISQDKFEEALRVYDRLARKEKDPEKVASLRRKAAELRKKLREAG